MSFYVDENRGSKKSFNFPPVDRPDDAHELILKKRLAH